MTGVCVFDIDRTITSPDCVTHECRARSHRNALALIEACRQRGMGLAVNTARKKHTWSGVAPEVRAALADAPYFHRGLMAPDAPRSVPDQKAVFMHDILALFRARRERVVLFDDRKENCDAVRARGFGCVHVPSDQADASGMHDAAIAELDRVLAPRAELLLVVRPGCPYCARFRPQWERVVREYPVTRTVDKSELPPHMLALVPTVPKLLLHADGRVLDSFGDSQWTSDAVIARCSQGSAAPPFG